MRTNAINSGMLYSSRIQQPAKQKANNQTFKGYWNAEALHVLNRSAEEMTQIGKLFHKSSDTTLREVTLVRGFFGWIKQKKSQQAYEKLKEYVNIAKLHRTEMETYYNTLNNVEKYVGLPEILKEEKEKTINKIKELDEIATHANIYYVTDEQIQRQKEEMKEINREAMLDYYARHNSYDW